jgi:hypothetical protein
MAQYNIGVLYGTQRCVCVGNLQHAARAEIDRILKETKGDGLTKASCSSRGYVTFNLITNAEVAAVRSADSTAILHHHPASISREERTHGCSARHPHAP